jgi:transcriptional regulator with XRE-family HTH domain
VWLLATIEKRWGVAWERRSRGRILPRHGTGQVGDNGAVTGDDTHAAAIGEFLRARRGDLTPLAVGLPETGSSRRVPGLRREEVAQLAAISVDYYTRLEQGRLPPSASILATLTRALRLDDDQQTYLYELAGKTAVRPRRRRIQQVRPPMRRLLDQLTETPAMVLGRRTDVLAWNSMAAALYADFAQIPEGQRNYIRLLFLHPAIRSLHIDWEDAAHTSVATLRMAAAQDPDDQRLAALVGELSVQDPDFRRWWGGHHVASTSFGTKRFHHPIVGDLTLDCDTWDSPDGHEQQLVVLTADPGTPAHQALRLLASWTAEPSGVQSGRQAQARGDRG